MQQQQKNLQYYKFCLYGFFKNLRFFEPFLMLFFLEKGTTFLQIGTLYAIREISILILEIPTGILADILGRRKTMITSFLAYIISFTIFFASNTFLLLVIAMLIFSFGDAMRTGTHKAMIFDYLKLNNWENSKIDYYGHTRSWSQIGSALSSLIAASIVIFTGNYQWIFLFSTIPYLFDLFLIISYPKVLDGPLKNSDGRTAFKIQQFWKQLVASFETKEKLKIFVNLATFHGLFKAGKDYLQPLVVLSFGSFITLLDTNKDNSTTLLIGLIYFGIYLISSVTSRNTKRITSHFKTPYQALNITLAIGIASLFISGLLINNDLNSIGVFAFVLLFIIQNIRKPLGSSIIAENFNSKILATGLSIQSLFDSLFTALFSIIIGLLADAFSIEKALLILSIALFIFLPLNILKTKNIPSNK